MSTYSLSFGKLIAGLCICVCFPGLARSQYFPRPSAVSEAKNVPTSILNLVRGVTENEEAIVQRFIETETTQRAALNQHMFKRDVVLQTIGPDGRVTGEYIRNSQFLFDDQGRRIERLIYHPPSTIREMRITREDIQDLAGSQLLGVDVTELAKYQFRVAGKEKLGSRDAIAIDVTPLIQPDPHRMAERFFVGRIWIDANTFRVVRTQGYVEPQGKQRFPHFETWREPINSTLVFPVRTNADDVLHFPARDVHYRITVRYYDYKLFACQVSIKEIDDVPPHQ